MMERIPFVECKIKTEEILVCYSHEPDPTLDMCVISL